jgi:ribosomal protein S27AE
MKHLYAIPTVKEHQLIEGLKGGGGFLWSQNQTQGAVAWLDNPAGAPRGWQESFAFCSRECAQAFLGTLTPNTIEGPKGSLAILSYNDFSAGKVSHGMEFDYTKAMSLTSIYAIVKSNLPAELRPAFEARASGSDLRNQESARARAAWLAGDYALAGDIYDKLGEATYASQARELAKTRRVINVSVNYNVLIEQLKELRKPIAYSCPKCGAGMTIDSNITQDRLKCAYCHTTFSIPDIMTVVNRMVAQSPVTQTESRTSQSDSSKP